ncbi:hypothetical protein NPIL_117871 [Nephila pilipes]|uniref:Uncharacterized protein n=1 Tax=Nephila pilipes TaxID=299642 RepID=A0A8X6NBP6_NEPPI|nr:hypothetical protein NPIL_117871 [Nephila pilipes]
MAHSREYPSKSYAPKRSSPDSRFDNTNQDGSTSSFSRANKDSANFSNISLHSYSSTPNQSVVLRGAVKGTWVTACSDSGASHSIARETIYLLLQREGANIQNTRLSISCAEGEDPSDSPHRIYDFVKEAIIQEVQRQPNIEEKTCLLCSDEALHPHQDPSTKPLTLLIKSGRQEKLFLPHRQGSVRARGRDSNNSHDFNFNIGLLTPPVVALKKKEDFFLSLVVLRVLCENVFYVFLISIPVM